MTSKFIIIVKDVDSTQQNLIHHRIKDLSDDWWHEYEDIWIVVGGGSVGEWKSELSVFLPEAPSAVMVFRLSNIGPKWAYLRAPGGGSWFLEHLTEADPAVAD